MSDISAPKPKPTKTERLEQEINEKQREIDILQDELDELEASLPTSRDLRTTTRRTKRANAAPGARKRRRLPFRRFEENPMTAVYQASPIKRQRATKVEVEQRREAFFAIIDAGRPMTVRQVFYQATVQGLVEKAETGYAKVQIDLTKMRRSGELPYGWLADNTRWQRKPRTFNSVEDALRDTAAFYRKDLWAAADCYCEIWLEKDALAGVVYPVTAQYDVPLMVARGYASLWFLHSAAETINELAVPAFIYHFGDFDPSGVNAGEKIEGSLRELAPDAEIYFERVAVTPEQIEEWNLPTPMHRSVGVAILSLRGCGHPVRLSSSPQLFDARGVVALLERRRDPFAQVL